MKDYRYFCLLLIVTIFFLATGSLSSQTSLKGNYVVSLDPKDLDGNWHLSMSSACKWKSKKRCNANLRFSVQAAEVAKELKYTKRKKSKTDTQVYLKGESSHFIPKETGVKRLFARSWYVVAMDKDKQWMVLYFSGTLFHREEIEVISRETKINESGMKEFDKLREENYFLHAKAKKMRNVCL